jgi:hypothetical protein
MACEFIFTHRSITSFDCWLLGYERYALNRCTARPVTESDIQDAVKYDFDLLKMSILLLETCRGI